MAQRKVAVVFTGLYLFIWPVWANLKVTMTDNLEVYLGDVAEISCMYNLNKPSDSPIIEWFVAGSNNKRGPIDFSWRMNVSNSQNGTVGESILTIIDVSIRDEQQFICNVLVDEESVENKTQLFVFKAPSHPKVSIAPYTSPTSEKLEEAASCEVSDGYPAPLIRWHKNNIPLTKFTDSVQVETRSTVNSNGLITVNSVLYLKVVKEDKDAVFYCEVIYKLPGSEKMVESQSFAIVVHYPATAATMTKETPEGLVKEGDRVVMKCEGNGNPQEPKTFYFEKEEVSSDSNFLILENVNRQKSGLYTCKFLDTNSFEELTANLLLKVHYLDPVVITPEKPDELDFGQDLSLTCNALSSLSTRTLWTKNGVMLKEGHTLTLENVSYDATGTYTCKIYASELLELQRENIVHIRVRGKPIITNITVIPEDHKGLTNVSCIAKGNPTPFIHWNLTDAEALLYNWTSQNENMTVSGISVKAKSDIIVSCYAINTLGSAEESQKIEGAKTTSTSTTSVSTKAPGTVTPQAGKKKEGNGVIIAVIIIFVLLLAILGSVLYFLYKKGRISCGRSRKQNLMKKKTSSDDIIVEMKSSKSEEAVLLQGVNGDKKIPSDQ